jgi:hypothetical protein
MGDIIIGSEALADGTVTRHELQRWYRPIFPNVHAPRDRVLTLHDRTRAAWLWSRRRAVITGAAAAALHGADWVDADVPIELIWDCTHPPRGIIARHERVGAAEITSAAGLPATTIERTALDLGRHLPRERAVARLDALMRTTSFNPEAVLTLAQQYRGARGVARVRDVLPLVDGGAASPRETRLRLLFIDAGLPAPATQIVILDECGRYVRTVDMGWPDYKVAAEYDGDQHQTQRPQYLKDRRVMRKLGELSWDVQQVVKEDHDADIVERAWLALRARGWNPAETATTKKKFERAPSGMPFRRKAS